MLKAKNVSKVVALTLAIIMLISNLAFAAPSSVMAASGSLGTPSGAKYSPVQLDSAPTKEMDYYNTQTPAGVTWVTSSTDLNFMPKAAIGDVTCAVKDTDDTYWVGTKKGMMRINFKEADQRDIVQYFAGPRYTYGGDDVVTGVALDNNGGVWVRNAKGSVHIRMPEKTMQERTYVYEKLVNDINDRRGMVSSNNGFSYDAATDEYYSSYVSTQDNDGLWTAMYAMGEIFRYQTLKATGAENEEIAAAKAAATRATKAVLLLDFVSGRGNGFPCRSYMLKEEAPLTGMYNNFQVENGFWFEKRLLNESETYPDPIIDEMKLEGKEPIGIATVRITKDAMNKKGSQVLASSDLFNGLGLSPSSIATFNTVRADGNKLGTDIVSGNGQVFPLMVEGVNTSPTSGNSSDIDPAKIKFRLTTPVYERIPTFFNDLFPASAIAADGYIDDSQIVYKADTSSDEVDGHYALFLTAYKYLCDTAEDSELKDIIVKATTDMTDLILKDDHYYIVDAHGKSTQWSRWLSEYFNDGMDMMKNQPQWQFNVGVDTEGNDHLSYGFEDGPLNALEVMAALKTAVYIAKDADPVKYADKVTTYEAAYDLCYESPYSGGGVNNDQGYINGKGYIDMANEYSKRRIIRQATDAYNNNDNVPVTQYEEKFKGNKTANAVLHNDWTQYVNYSDEELGWFPVYSLLILETDPQRKAQIVSAYDQWYENQEEREENPFYTFLYQLAHPEKTNVDLNSAVRYFYRSPQIRNQSLNTRGDRQDVFFIEPCERDKTTSQTNYALPMDERNISKNNSNPFTRYSGFTAQSYSNYSSGSLDCGTVFTLSYWFGRYYGMITEKANGEYYTKKNLTTELTSGQAANGTSVDLILKASDGGSPIARVIVDFYADGKYIGRARTDENGEAKLTTDVNASSSYSATTTERLVGKNMYLTSTSSAAPINGRMVKMAIPENYEMVVGESRSIETLILPGSSTDRTLTWSSSDETKAVVDKYGRVTALAAGNVTIKAETTVEKISSEAVINIVASATKGVVNKSAVSYTATNAATAEDNLQKLVDRYTLAEASTDANVPEAVKNYIADTSTGGVTEVTDAQGATWKVESYGIVRTQANEENDRDKVQYFMNERYLPAGTISFIASDNNNGLWVVSDSGVTHIRMETMSYQEKAIIMSDASQKYVSRRGMVSQASRDATASNGWRPKETDNDGLWTSMYGVGELYRYAELKKAFEAGDSTVTQQMVDDAKAVATKSAEAVLLLGNISMRTGTVDAKVRYMANDSNQMSGNALLKGKNYAVFSPVVGPAGGDRFGTNHTQGAQDVFNPVNLLDWLDPRTAPAGTEFETRKRSLSGFVARTYRLAGLEGEDAGAGSYNDGYYYDVTGNTATCLATTSTKVKWETLAGVTVDASSTVPERLAKLYNTVTNPLTGQPFSKDDIIYKADTSTDELIGHLFIYKVAYDVLGAEDPELKQIIADTVKNLALHYVENGYGLKDATGQSTTWGKTDRDYFNNSYAWEDCSLSAMVVLNAFKLAGYVTGEQRWEDEYRMLALEAPYEYAKLAGEYWERWVYYAVEDGCDANNQEEINEWIQQNLNYSDEEMAMLAYYLIFQMESDNTLLGKYRTGLDAWWNSMKYSENPLWYYIYQLAYPETTVKDAYGNNLIDTASWALKRHPVDTITWSAYTAGRPGVTQDGELSKDEAGNITVVPQDERNLHKFNGSTYELEGGNPNKMEGSTTYTLPYWLGRYHNMIE